EGKYGRAPDGRDALVLGHENLGRVRAVGDGARGFSAGDLVVATVRRGCGSCRFCRSNRSDFCETGRFTERGISGRDGYLAASYADVPEYLVRVPEELRSAAVLLEPLSVVEKALEEGGIVLGRREPTRDPPTRPLRALIAGTGAIGMLAAFRLRSDGADVTAIDRHGEGTSAATLLREIGARHVDVSAGLASLGQDRFDMIVEAGGSATLDLGLWPVLGPNGVLVLTGIPPPDALPVAVPASRLFRDLVLNNQALVGSVNANRTYFERGVRDLAVFRERFGSAIDRVIGSRRPLSDHREVLAERAEGSIKTVLTVGPPSGPR
ncbi:MAG TPA: alcohol dehydrogenase catalytic domain-containing protein, partial [Thermoplasmata archaeon]|nr:alcohol dehydrogenase catalytic domain-containing protein [Thermoplasmata archaeon]